jgi:hypothetical protein
VTHSICSIGAQFVKNHDKISGTCEDYYEIKMINLKMAKSGGYRCNECVTLGDTQFSHYG